MTCHNYLLVIMDVWIPTERAAEGMKDTDKPRDKVSGFVQREKTFFDDIRNSLEKAVKQSAVFEEKRRRDSSMVKTRWRWVHCINLKDIAVDLSLEYLAPQEGQNLEWQRKGTNLRLPQWGQPYMAPP